MCAMTGVHTPRSRRWWTFYHQIFRYTHDHYFIGQDHRVLRSASHGRERLSPWDQDLVRWRLFAVQNARGYRQDQSPAATEQVSAHSLEEAMPVAEQATPVGSPR
jgi:hypothetical protein